MEFNTAAALSDELLIWDFRDGLRPLVRAPLDKWDRDITNMQDTIAHTVNVKAKIKCQALSLAWENDVCYLYN